MDLCMLYEKLVTAFYVSSSYKLQDMIKKTDLNNRFLSIFRNQLNFKHLALIVSAIMR